MRRLLGVLRQPDDQPGSDRVCRRGLAGAADHTRLVEDFCRRPAPDGAAAEAARLSQRELDVVRQVAKGLSNSEIAGQLYVSDATVKSHVARILARLGLRDWVQIVVFAYENGIIRPGESSQAKDRKPQPGRRS